MKIGCPRHESLGAYIYITSCVDGWGLGLKSDNEMTTASMS